MPPGFSAAQRRIQQLALQLGELGDVARAACASAPRGDGAARRARCTARRAGCGRTAGLGAADARAVELPDRHVARSNAARALAHQFGAGRHQSRWPRGVAPPASASAASTAALPPGPAHRSSQRSPGRIGPGPAEREGGELRALVLHPGASVAARRASARGRRRRHGRVRREPAGARAGQLGAWPGRAARPGSRAGAALSAVSSGIELVVAALRGQRAPEGAHDPHRVRVLGGRAARRRSRPRPSTRVAPARRRAAGDRAQHAVDESRGGRGSRPRAPATTDSSTAACWATRIDSSWCTPSRSTSSIGGVDLARRAGARRAR